ncbi:MAG: hypothetical protein IKE76_02235, partial [Clostridia bacterium]|nr:hypothetical protein [Clostridia bacterium]
MPDKKHRRRGDRFDATLVRDLDPLHWFFPYIYPNRADNEAFIREEFDLTNLNAFLAKKNEGLDHAHRYTVFHAVAAAIVKAVTLRPRMNRFIKGCRLYQRDELSLGFVVKKHFADDGGEGLAFIKFPEDTTIDSLHARIMDEIFECRRDDVQDNSTQGMEMFTHLPRWLMRIVMWGLHRLDFY